MPITKSQSKIAAMLAKAGRKVTVIDATKPHKAPIVQEFNHPPCECGSPRAAWHGNRAGHRERLCDACWLAKHIACITDLRAVVNEFMPQIGRCVLQDYERLNRALLIADALLDAHDND